jgi:hypothetical protein
VPWSKRFGHSVVGSGRGWPKEEKKLKAIGRMKAPYGVRLIRIG